MSDDGEEFRDPEELISASTLERFNEAEISPEALTAAVDVEDSWWETLDAATRLSVEEAAVGLASAAVAEHPELGDVCEALCVRSSRAGYWLARLALETLDRNLAWSADAEEDATALDDACGRMDFAALAITGSDELLEGWCAHSGHAGDEDLLSVVAMTFDNAVATALVEQDLWEAAPPGGS